MALQSIIFLQQKRLSTTEACACACACACTDGRPQRGLYEKYELSSPTVKTESVVLTAVIDAKEKRYVGVHDIPSVFLHSMLEGTV